MQRRLVAIATNPRRYIRTEGGEAAGQQRGPGAAASGPEQRAAAAKQAVQRRAEVLRRTGSYFEQPAEPADAPEGAPAPRPGRSEVKQCDIFTVRRESKGAEGR